MIGFAQPWLLLALLVLPLLALLLRLIPPAPVQIVFPPAVLMADLTDEAPKADTTPWWLIALRLCLLALVILALSGPVWRPSHLPQGLASGSQADGQTVRGLIVLDDGWRAAGQWPDWIERARAQVALLPQRARVDLVGAVSGRVALNLNPAEARAQLGGWTPQAAFAYAPEALAALRTLAGQTGAERSVLWLQDGKERADSGDWRTVMGQLAGNLPVRLVQAQASPLIIRAVTSTAKGIEIEVERTQTTSARQIALAVEARDGAPLAAANGVLATGQARLVLPVELDQARKARAGRVRLLQERHAGAVFLLDRSNAPPFAVLVDQAAQAGSPLLDELHYVESALAPFASLVRSPLETALGARPDVLVLVDRPVSQEETAGLQAFVRDGGLLIRFAGPAMLNRPDALVPQALREKARAFSGKLGWEAAPGMAPFEADSPLAGVPVPTGLAIRMQALETPGGSAQVWGRLSDGSSWITASTDGAGRIVLVHVTAGPAWSDLPLSGLAPALMARLVSLAGRGARAMVPQDGPWTLDLRLDGFGDLSAPRGQVVQVKDSVLAQTQTSAARVAGLYVRAGDARAVNVGAEGLRQPDFVAPPGWTLEALRNARGGPDQPVALQPFLLLAACALAFADLLLAWLMGGGRWSRLAAGAVLLGAVSFATPDQAASAQARYADAEATSIGLIPGSDSTRNLRALVGLEVLTQALQARTSVAATKPRAVDLSRDELGAFSVLYWPVSSADRVLTPAQGARLRAFLDNGGTLLIDVVDGPGELLRQGGALSRHLQAFAAPPLEPVKPGHVIGKAFYLMDRFPGRFDSRELWVQQADTARADGVSALFVGASDWGGAWARFGALQIGQSPEESRQQELAIRFGINLVMVALTGSYKSDQVHAAAVLERMGR